MFLQFPVKFLYSLRVLVLLQFNHYYHDDDGDEEERMILRGDAENVQQRKNDRCGKFFTRTADHPSQGHPFHSPPWKAPCINVAGRPCPHHRRILKSCDSTLSGSRFASVGRSSVYDTDAKLPWATTTQLWFSRTATNSSYLERRLSCTSSRHSALCLVISPALHDFCLTERWIDWLGF